MKAKNVKRTPIEKYLMEKHGFFKKMLEITQEQKKALEKKDVEKFKRCVEEISMIISKIEEIDRRFQTVREAWESGRQTVPPGEKERIHLVSGDIQGTIEQIMKLQPGQMERLTEEKKLLEKELVTFRRDQKSYGSYEKTQTSARFLDIKK